MKRLELTDENLELIGVTKDIFKNSLDEWLLENDNYIIDYHNKFIYIGKTDVFNAAKDLIDLVANIKVSRGANQDEYINKMINNIKDAENKFTKNIEIIPEHLLPEYYYNFFKSNGEMIENLKKVIYSIINNEFLDEISLEIDNNNENKDYNIKNTENTKYFNNLESTILTKNKEFNKYEKLDCDYPFFKNCSKKAKLIFNEILINNSLLIDIIDCINENTTSETKHFLIKELKSEIFDFFEYFMLYVSVEDISNALNENNIKYEYLYIHDYEEKYVSSLIRIINNVKTVYNVTGFKKHNFKNSIKLLYLNNIMIDYLSDEFMYDSNDYTYLGKLKKVYNYLNENYVTENNTNAIYEFININDNFSNSNINDNNNSINNQSIIINKYPRIFKDNKSYTIFFKLVESFGKDKECLSNYSYVFYKMTYEGLIHYDIPHKTYIEMLSEFDIYIDRIKPKADIGKIALRDSIYSKIK